MSPKNTREIKISGAKTNNLKNVSLSIPHNKLIVVTGISGSGKSSLVFDILAQEGQRRYFETLPSFSRQFLGKLNRPEVDEIEGLSPVISIGQSTSGMHSKSTVGTMTDIYDFLRLLFARIGQTDKNIEVTRSLFSFNSDKGKCHHCNGIGKEEQIDLNKLIQFPEKTIREGALAPTLPTGYIMYSQVTIDVLNQVCEAEGFSVDVKWNDLTEEQKNVILYGSDKIKVPFGKHSLESRLKWTGIKAKPREEGYYKGMIPIMSDILRRDRNANILKYVESITCRECNGTRLNHDALSVKVHKKSIAELSEFTIGELESWIAKKEWNEIGQKIVDKISAQMEILSDLGLNHLNLNRPAKSLSASEIQRIRMANQMNVALSDVLYIFDEPSIGLHPEENQRMIYHFKNLVSRGNTVIVVEHDLDTIRAADHIIDIGPEAGINGGEIIFNGSFKDFVSSKDLKEVSPTFRALQDDSHVKKSVSGDSSEDLELIGCNYRNLQNIDARFQLGKLNVVSGKSGSGKSSLVKETLMEIVSNHLDSQNSSEFSKVRQVKNLDKIDKLVFVDHTPIGRTPRSNPATYLGLSDVIRDVFAALPASKERKYTKSRFSFNNKGGRCETCQGAGKIQIGMHFLGNVDLVCGTCNGDRFNKETLEVKLKNKSIADIYRLSISEAITFFSENSKLVKGLKLLENIGLGYLTLGQSSTTLSGGEAQRIKIANQLQKKDTGNTLYVIVEPSIGLHHSNIQSILNLFQSINQKGNTIVCIEQNEEIIQQSDWHIELGPEGGKNGGKIVYQGPPRIVEKKANVTVENEIKSQSEIRLNGVRTHFLKNLDVVIPKNELTVVTGLSGSGKSSLVYDTLFAEANARFTESLSTYNRSFIQQNSEAELDSYAGLSPAIGINRRGGSPSKRSTVGTISGVYDAFRLLYSRITQNQGKQYTAQHFSFNHHLGACHECKGLGNKLKVDPNQIIVEPFLPIFEGAISKNKSIQFYADVNGQFVATLKTVAEAKKWDLSQPWSDLNDEVKNEILYGTGDTEWDVQWKFKNKTREGTQEITTKWLGFCSLVDDEYQRKIQNKNIQSLEELLHSVECDVCEGSRLQPELLEIHFQGKNIFELSQLSISDCYEFLSNEGQVSEPQIQAISSKVLTSIRPVLKQLIDLGLGYLDFTRSAATLSGGERQRVALAGHFSSNLYGVIYVLDEPTIGLDDEQVSTLVSIFRKLISNGNTVVVVEHNPELIRKSDYIIELGPQAGKEGGHLMYQGPLKSISKAPDTVTNKLLNLKSKAPSTKRIPSGKEFGVKGARANNLKNISVSFNVGQVTAVCGVSGSGKSSLIKDVLFASASGGRPVNCDSTFGLDQFEEVLFIDQKQLSTNRLLTPASYTGILSDLQTMFASSTEAKELGLKKADFSYQSKNGKCAHCGGHGKVKTSLDFMSDVWLTCDFCHGARYNDRILSCTLNGVSIGDVLKFTVNEAKEFFENRSSIHKKLDQFQKLGLGHLMLGQSGNTLSGGEAQRLKLALSILKKSNGPILYLFDEPSTGLHYFDILQLTQVFDELVEDGNTIIFIEHNSTLIQRADEVITLGPGSGVFGGEITCSNN